MNRSLILLTQIVLSVVRAHAADNHALLIGVGAYKSAPKLDGPPHDVDSIRSLLLDKYHYHSRFVHTLVDQQATRQAIVQAMKDLVSEVKPGDYVFFYYSGHGTSYDDSDNKFRTAISEDTAASLPVDFDYSSRAAFGKSILLGTELRSFFIDLDAKAQVFAVFDSCYSQDAMKAITKGTPKYFHYGTFDATLKPCDASSLLPYRHLIAISAAKCNQTAVDVSDDFIKSHPNATVDGRAHGRLTNAILRGLQGAADKNHDGVISHEELFNYVSELSASNWGHNPSLRVSADSSNSLQQPAFAGQVAGLDTTCVHLPDRQPRVTAPADLFSKLGKGFRPVTEDWDIKAVSQNDRFLLYDAGGIQLNEAPMSPEKALARLRAEPLLEQLSDLRYCQQRFNVQLGSDQPDRGRYLQGQTITFSAKLDGGAYLLVIDIDQEGGVTVIYPSSTAARPLPAGKTVLTKTEVLGPFGVDLIKAFAFESKPEGFDGFLAPLTLPPGDPRLTALLSMVKTDGPDRSETKIGLITGSN
jgi:hypothetical protein